MSGGYCGSDGSGGFDGGLIGVSALIIQNNSMILKSSMIQREFQLDAWTLIIQKFTVIPPSSMVLFSPQALKASPSSISAGLTQVLSRKSQLEELYVDNQELERKRREVRGATP